MSALQAMAHIVEQEKIEKEELKTLLSSVLNKLDTIEGRISLKETSEDRFLTKEEVCEMVGVSISWLYDKAKKGEFPKQIKFGDIARWSLKEVQQWMSDKKLTG